MIEINLILFSLLHFCQSSLVVQPVPKLVGYECGTKDSFNLITVNQKSDGTGASSVGTLSEVSLCYDNTYLVIDYISYLQNCNSQSNYSSCNDPVYLLDVIEVFIGPHVEDPHCYLEFDISPYNTPYEANIYNPNLNQSGIQNTLLDCNTSNIRYESNFLNTTTWRSHIEIPWSDIDCLEGCNFRITDSCPSAFQTHSRKGKVYRLNFYRINEILPTTNCNTSTCEYLAWSPTYQNPPAFHVPPYFGYLELQ
jgi:hypothetical protein